MGSPIWAYRRPSAYANPASIRHRRHVKRGLTCTCYQKESQPVKKTIATLAASTLAGAALAVTVLTASDNSAQEAARYASTVAACKAAR